MGGEIVTHSVMLSLNVNVKKEVNTQVVELGQECYFANMGPSLVLVTWVPTCKVWLFDFNRTDKLPVSLSADLTGYQTLQC